MTLLLSYGLFFGSAVLMGLASYPHFTHRINAYLNKGVEEAKLQLEDMFVDLSPKRLMNFYVLAPPVLALVLWVATGFWVIGTVGFAVGILVPRLMLKYARHRRYKQFHAQLVDTMLLLSSSLRAGLSMVQAFTVVAEEMPAPVNQEFGLILKETRMGVSLEEVLLHLKQRMTSDDVNLFITTVLVARETGGDVTTVFGKLVDTIRERRKIRERIQTLTFMAKMQGILMGCLPIAFLYVVYTMDKSHFQFFLTDPMGKALLAGVIVMQVISFLLFMRFSKSPL